MHVYFLPEEVTICPTGLHEEPGLGAALAGEIFIEIVKVEIRSVVMERLISFIKSPLSNLRLLSLGEILQYVVHNYPVISPGG